MRTNSPFASLRRFARPGPLVERCDLCRAELAPVHQHLFEPKIRHVLCACDACALLFDNREGKYRRVPRRIRLLLGFHLTNAQWENLFIPINLAFFYHDSTRGGVVALYPSPAGATESLLPLESWVEIEAANPFLKGMEPDVEALLVNRLGSIQGLGGSEYFLAPIDECFKLVGVIRARWHGLSGGAQVWDEVGSFFASLHERAITINGVIHA